MDYSWITSVMDYSWIFSVMDYSWISHGLLRSWITHRLEVFINSEMMYEPASSVDELVSQYNCTLKNLLDEHASKKSCFVMDHPMVP